MASQSIIETNFSFPHCIMLLPRQTLINIHMPDYYMDAFELVNEARSSIGTYCMNECKAQCCRRGFLPLLNKQQMDAVIGRKQNEFIKSKIITKKNNISILDMNKHQCPKLTEDFKCGIYNNKERPQSCADYPLMLANNMLIAASNCPAVQNGLLNKYFSELKKLGVKII